MSLPMNTANISLSNGEVFSDYDIMAIRLGLLVGDTTYSIGDLHIGIMVENSTNEKRTHYEKLDAIYSYIVNFPEQAGIEMENFENTASTYKYLKNIKYKSPNQIKEMKGIEKLIDGAYNSRNEFYSNRYQNAGMPQLKKFVDRSLKLLATHPTSAEVRINERYYLMSEIVTDRFDTTTGDDIFLVTGNFTEYLQDKKIITSAFGPNADVNAQLLCKKNMFVLPNLNLLTQNELEMVREELTSKNETFRTNMANWNKALINIPFAHPNFEMISQTYINEIEPFAKLLKTEMDNNERLKVQQAHSGTVHTFAVHLYVTSVGFYWDYLHHINNVGEDTMKVLQQKPDYEAWRKSSCIIIAGCLLDHTGAIVENDKRKRALNNVPELTKRKTLDI